MKRKREEDQQIDTSTQPLDLQSFFKAPDEISTSDYLGSLTNPYQFRSWWNSIQTIPKDSYEKRAILYQKSLHYLPGSYKLWYNYLKESKRYIKKFNAIEHENHYEVVNDLFEKALVYMNKMPKIWLDYAQFLNKQQLISRTRQVYDRALKVLPVTQHGLIWSFYLEWACQLEDFTDTAKHVFRRYIEFKPEGTEDFISYLLEHDELEDALDLYLQILQDDGFVSSKSKSHFQLWMELCEFLAKNPTRSNFPDPSQIIRHAIRTFTDEVGKLWIFLADFFIRQGLFGKTRDVFEEALATVTTARDFGIIFNAYMKFEEQMIDAEAEEDQEEEEDEEDGEGIQGQIEMLVEYTFKDIAGEDEGEDEEMEEEGFKFSKEDGVDMRYFRLENLIQRRPFLLSNTVLRQNQNNVYEWLNRIKLCQEDRYLCIKTYTEAIATVDPQQAFGKCSQLWIDFAHFYEQNEDLENANAIFHKATQLQFKSIDEVANIYCQWGEMHVRHRNYESALMIMQHACSGAPKKRKRAQRGDNSQQLLYNNTKVWAFYIDLLENLSSFDSTKMAYERLMDLRIATPQNILNYTSYLQRNNYYEESFRVYERAINLFSWPHLYEMWGSYLSKIIERYQDKKLERIRDLFHQVLKSAPSKQAKLFFLMYADYEENYGLINHAMEIYDRAVKELDREDRFEIYNLYIAKSAEFFGVTKTRQLFERAFEVLQGLDLIEIGLRFAKLERKLGEIDRARGIYKHLSQYCNPRVKDNEEKFWSIWEKFEVYHGNEDTYEDYMRTKRTVELRYSVANPVANSDKVTEFMKEIKELEEGGENGEAQNQ